MKNKKKNSLWGVVVPVVLILIALGWMFKLHEQVFKMVEETSLETEILLEQEYPLWSSLYDRGGEK